MKRLTPIFLLLFCITLLDVEAQRRRRNSTLAPSFSTSEYDGLKWRNLGPYRGGRANSITGISGNDQVYYAGYTGGGVWKTEDAGYNWVNVSDGFFKVGTIGDIGVSKSDPNVVYVGSGEHAVRGVTTSYGDGVYKSEDAGATWKNVGLEGTRHISDVVVHPTNPDVVYIGAQGPVHGASPDRGVYKSADGGQTWRKTLYVNDGTGVSGLSMDPSNPRILYAATWEHRRYPWKVVSGGPGSSIYKSTDGGETWNKITKGLPEMMGKIGIAVSPANPQRVYAIIESEKEVSGLYRSDDAGASWKLMSNNQTITSRSWYYMEVSADPQNEDLVYVLNAPLMKSIDGGKTFESMRMIHGDCHELYINPEDGNNIALAEDGGGTISFNRGKTWSSFNNQSTAQIYRITADKQVPYWVYGGQQDNFSVAIPSRSKNYGILSTDWFNGPGCESAMVTMDNLENPRVLYGGCFNGRISLLDVVTKEAKNIMAYPGTTLGYEPKDMKYRFNWNAPLINSPHDVRTMYYGGNVLFKTTNGGLTWTPISPDLTKNDQEKQGQGGGPFTNEGAGGENYNTIYYIAESTLEEGVIYTGSNGGMLQVTLDGGENWTNITPSGLPETMIHSIEVSPHEKGTVYFASTRYKFNDQRNYSYKSTDYGMTWKKIGDDINKDDFFRVIREDTKVPGLLYAGAERGFYISFDGGNSFQQMQLNMPIVSITDLVIRDNDLAASTAGRGFWILDDLSSIQQSKGKFSGAMQLFEPKPVYRSFGSPPFYLITEHGYGENPEEGVTLHYYLQNEPDSAELVTLEIMNTDGDVIRSFKGKKEIPQRMQGGRGNIPAPNTEHLPVNRGINRFTWDYRTNKLTEVPGVFVLEGDYRGHRVAPGNYTAKMTVGDNVSEANIVIMDPPDVNISERQWAEQQALMEQIEDRINEIHDSVNDAIKISNQLESIEEQYGKEEGMEEIQEAIDELQQKMEDWRTPVIELRQKGFQDALNWPAGINSEFFFLRNNLDTYDPSVPDSYKERVGDLEDSWGGMKEAFDDLQNDIREFNELFKSKNAPILTLPKKEEQLNN